MIYKFNLPGAMEQAPMSSHDIFIYIYIYIHTQQPLMGLKGKNPNTHIFQLPESLADPYQFSTIK